MDSHHEANEDRTKKRALKRKKVFFLRALRVLRGEKIFTQCPSRLRGEFSSENGLAKDSQASLRFLLFSVVPDVDFVDVHAFEIVDGLINSIEIKLNPDIGL
jgi:hypothetical protein